MRRALPHLTALACGVAAALVVGCGDRSNLVPAGDAQTLKDQLAQIRQGVDAGDCATASQALRDARSTAQSLPSAVDRRLRTRINDGIRALEDSVPRDCAAAQPDTTPTDTTPTDTTPTVTETTPTVTETTPTVTETTPTDTTPPPSDATPGTATTPDTGGTPGEVPPP